MRWALSVTMAAAMLAAGWEATAMGEEAKAALSAERMDARIQEHRTAEVALTVEGPDGEPLAAQAVTIRQVRHKFLFGSNAFRVEGLREPAMERAYRKRFSDLLNFATLPFYWGSYEPQQGKTSKDRLTKMAQWCRSEGIRTKGHPLCWHTVVPPWLQGKEPAEAEALQWARIERDAKDFAGLVDTWDVVNEAVVMPGFNKPNPISRLCKSVGQVELIKRAFDHARKANPTATLLLNDFDVSPRYQKLLRECLDAGVPIDVIGIQSHMHAQYWGPQKAWEVCERFAKLGKPLHFTELTILSGKDKTDQDWMGHHPGWDSTPEGEKLQAERVAELYTVLFSHPSVEAITWWDFSDEGAWQGAPAGLVRKDMSPKPAYDALMKLVKGAWWTREVKQTTDEKGRVTFRGFLGDYTVEAPAGKGAFALDRSGKRRVSVTVRPRIPE